MHVILHIDNQLASKFILLMKVIQQLFIQIEGPIERVVDEGFALKSHHAARSRLLCGTRGITTIVSSVIPVVVLDQRKKANRA